MPAERNEHPVRAVEPTRLRRCSGLAWKSIVVAVVILGGWWTITHRVAGVTWREVGGLLGQVPVVTLVGLGGLWFAGLAIYATVLAAAMPGLGLRRGLVLNLSGSAVANLVPLGGAVATGLNWQMARRWGCTNAGFVSYCVLTNGLDVVTKLMLPGVAVLGLWAVSATVPPVLWAVCLGSVALGVVVVGGPGLLVRVLPNTDPRRAASGLRWRVSEIVDQVQAAGRGAWSRLVPGSIGYVAAQVLLLACCLHAVGLHIAVPVVLMAAAIERLGTLIPITPGGTGIAEIGTIAWLIANGVDATGAVAGVLLYRIFLIALEIPVGGAVLGAWLVRHWRTSQAVSPTRVSA